MNKIFKYIILDRDGTLIKDKNYLHDPQDVELLPGVVDGLKKLASGGFKFIVLTNQSGIGRGYYKESDLFLVNERISSMLSDEGIEITRYYYCPHKPEEECCCRKPKPGMVYRACSDLEIDFDGIHCVIGDKKSDVELADNIGVKSVLVLTGYGRSALEEGACASYVADDLDKAAELLLKT